MEKFSITNRYGLEIVGEIRIPKNPIGCSFVIHGLGGFKEQPNTMAMVDTLFDNNYVVINFDATNSFGESGGKYENATMQLHYEDLVDVINWAKEQSWYREPFILAGHSLGGYAVARYAEDYPNEVKGVFPFALVVSGELSYKKNQQFKPEEFKNWKETGWKEEESKSKPGVIKRLPWSHMEERLKHDLLPNAYKLTMPILFVMGENDSSCPPEHQKVLFDALPEITEREFCIIQGAPHTFKEEHDLNELKTIFGNWIKNLK